jgi:hypothetical protein
MAGPLRFLCNSRRDLAAFTHVDVLFQAYFTAFLVLAGINANPPGSFTAGGAPLNSGNQHVRDDPTANGTKALTALTSVDLAEDVVPQWCLTLPTC